MHRWWVIGSALLIVVPLDGYTAPATSQERSYEVIVRNPEVVHDRSACGGASYVDAVEVTVIRSESPRLAAGDRFVLTGWSNCGITAGCRRLTLSDLDVRQARNARRVGPSFHFRYRPPRAHPVECPSE